MRGSGFRLPVLALSLIVSLALSAMPVYSKGAGIQELTSASPTLSPTATASLTASPIATGSPTATATATRPTETHTPIGWLTPTPTASATPYATRTPSEHRAMLPIIVRHHPLTMPVGFELVNQIGGATWAVAVQGSYAYVMVGPRLMVMDVSDPRRPTVLGQTAVLQPADLEGWGQMHISVQDGRVYVPLGDAGLSIIDVTDGAHPVEVARYEAGGARNVVTAGQYAYLADTELGMHILSISDPAHPRLVALYSISSGARDVDVANGYAYVAVGAESGSLIVVSVADAKRPQFVASLGAEYGGGLVTVAGAYAYLIAGDLYIIDISDPTQPHQVSWTRIYGACGSHQCWTDVSYAFVVSGTHAYMGTYYGGLRIIDVSDPVQPQLLSEWGSAAYDVSVAGSVALVVSNDGLHILSLEDLQDPVELGYHAECAPGRVIVSGDRAYVGDDNGSARFMSVLDISDPTSVVPLGNCQGRWPLAVAGTIAFMYTDEGTEIVDLSDSTCGTLLALLPYGFFSDLEVRGQLAYLLTYHQIRIVIVDIADPSRPFVVGWADIPYFDVYGGQFDVAGDYAYVGTGSGLFVVDVSNPASPHRVAQLSNPEGPVDYTAGLLVDRSVVYMLSGEHGYGRPGVPGVLWVLDATDPIHPTTVRIVPLALGGLDLAAAHPLLYIAKWDGLQVMDMGDLDRSLFYDTPGYCQDVALHGELVYLADQLAGLLILRPLY